MIQPPSPPRLRALVLALALQGPLVGCDSGPEGLTGPETLRLGQASLVMTGDLSLSTQATGIGSVVKSPVPGLTILSGALSASSSSHHVAVGFGTNHPDARGRRPMIPVLHRSTPSSQVEGTRWATVNVTVQRSGLGAGLATDHFDATGEGWLEVLEYGLDPSGNRTVLLSGDVGLAGFDLDPTRAIDPSPNGRTARIRLSARVPLDCVGPGCS